MGDLPKIMPALGLEGEPFPIVWTTDLIPVDGPDGGTDYTVGEFNCSCVGISKFQAAHTLTSGLKMLLVPILRKQRWLLTQLVGLLLLPLMQRVAVVTRCHVF